MSATHAPDAPHGGDAQIKMVSLRYQVTGDTSTLAHLHPETRAESEASHLPIDLIRMDTKVRTSLARCLVTGVAYVLRS